MNIISTIVEEAEKIMNKNDNLLRCETCGQSTYETPIIEKPFRFAFLSDVQLLEQQTGDHRKQENICLDCLNSEIEKEKSKYEKKLSVSIQITEGY